MRRFHDGKPPQNRCFYNVCADFTMINRLKTVVFTRYAEILFKFWELPGEPKSAPAHPASKNRTCSIQKIVILVCDFAAEIFGKFWLSGPLPRRGPIGNVQSLSDVVLRCPDVVRGVVQALSGSLSGVVSAQRSLYVPAHRTSPKLGEPFPRHLRKPIQGNSR